MNASALYDLSPALSVLLVGAALALLPLGWLAWRLRDADSARRRHALTVLTLLLTFDLVLFGAFTRLTDSGLGCPDWPGCYGNASPIGARHDIAAAQSALPSGPVTHGKAWIEMTHRYLATGVGGLILVLVGSAWRERRQSRQIARDRAAATPHGPPAALGIGWPLLTLGWVCVQGAFGALTVTMKLFPAIVTLHLLGGLVLLAMLAVQAARGSLALRGEPPAAAPAGLRRLLWVTFALVVLQIALGGWVSTNYAVLACSSFPQCQGQWWPPMDFTAAFQLWRPLGLLADGSLLGFPALTAIHMTHRLMAIPVLLALGLLGVRLLRVPALATAARWTLLIALAQLATGLSNVLLGWPLAAAVAHTGGAAALVALLSWTLAASRRAPQPARQRRSGFARAAAADGGVRS